MGSIAGVIYTIMVNHCHCPIIILLGNVYSQKVLDSCNVSVVPMLSSTQHGVKVSDIPELKVLADCLYTHEEVIITNSS